MERHKASFEDEIEIVYKLCKHGWSDLIVIVGDQVHSFGVTHIFSDPISDLIDFCDLLLDGEDGSVRLHDEPGTTDFEVTTDPDQRHLVGVRISVSQFSHAPKNSMQLFSSFHMKRSQLLALFIYQFEKVEALCRERSYARDRPAFPLAAFRRLQRRWREHPLSRPQRELD